MAHPRGVVGVVFSAVASSATIVLLGTLARRAIWARR